MVLSLDCSTTAIGWAVFNDKDVLIEYGRIEPTDKSLDWIERVHNLFPQLEDLILKYKPNKIYQEDVPMGGSGGALILSQLSYLKAFFLLLKENIVMLNILM